MLPVGYLSCLIKKSIMSAISSHIMSGSNLSTSLSLYNPVHCFAMQTLLLSSELFQGQGRP